jgi:hypothetical protein
MTSRLFTLFLFALPACQYEFDLELAPEGDDLIACSTHEYCDPQVCGGFVTGNEECDRDGWYIYDDGEIIEGDEPGDGEAARFLCVEGQIRFPHCVSDERRFTCDGKDCAVGQVCGVVLENPGEIRCVWPSDENADCRPGDCLVNRVCVELLEIEPDSGSAFQRSVCLPGSDIGP